MKQRTKKGLDSLFETLFQSPIRGRALIKLKLFCALALSRKNRLKYLQVRIPKMELPPAHSLERKKDRGERRGLTKNLQRKQKTINKKKIIPAVFFYNGFFQIQ